MPRNVKRRPVRRVTAAQLSRVAAAFGRLGGLARKRRCTPAQLSAIGKLGAAARHRAREE